MCGLNAQAGQAHTDGYGLQPRIEFLIPNQTIKIGGLIAKETEPTPTAYIWGSPSVPQISQIAPTNGNYTSAPYLDGLPGEPFSTTLTVTARF